MSLKISGRERERGGRRPQSSSSPLRLSLLRRVQISSSLSLLCSRRQKKDAAAKEWFRNVFFFRLSFLGRERGSGSERGGPLSQCSPPTYTFFLVHSRKKFFTGRRSEAEADVSGCRPPPPPPPQEPSVRK